MLLFGVVAAGLVAFFWLGAMRQGATPIATPTPSASLGARRETLAREVILEGRDEEGDPFHIEAVRSRRPEGDRNTLILEDAIGRIDTPTGVPTHFRADTIIYRQDSRLAELRGNVVIEKPDRWTLTAPLVHVDTVSNTLHTDRPVEVNTDGGIVQAQGMRSEKEGRTVFSGPVHAVFDASSEDGGPEADMEAE